MSEGRSLARKTEGSERAANVPVESLSCLFQHRGAQPWRLDGIRIS